MQGTCSSFAVMMRLYVPLGQEVPLRKGSYMLATEVGTCRAGRMSAGARGLGGCPGPP